MLGEKGALYDQQTSRVLKRTLRPGSCCVDIGAHRGEILKEIVAYAPQGHHYAFEPIPHLADYLKGRFPQVTLFEVALADFTGRSQFCLVRNATAYSGLRRRIYDMKNPEIETIQVQVTTLDECLSSAHVDFVKIDVEGGEYHVLKGALALLTRCRPVIIFEAGKRSTGQYNVTPANLEDLLVKQLNYSLTTMDRWLRSVPALSAAEFQQSWEEELDYYFLADPRGR